MTSLLIVGMIEFNKPRVETGKYLTRDSFGQRSGTVPVAWAHWRDNDHKFTNMATWEATESGLFIRHYLNLDDKFEEWVAGQVQHVGLFWSYGLGASPGATRNAIATYDRLHALSGRPVQRRVVPLTGERIEHVSLNHAAAFEQQPIWIVWTASTQSA